MVDAEGEQVGERAEDEDDRVDDDAQCPAALDVEVARFLGEARQPDEEEPPDVVEDWFSAARESVGRWS